MNADISTEAHTIMLYILKTRCAKEYIASASLYYAACSIPAITMENDASSSIVCQSSSLSVSNYIVFFAQNAFNYQSDYAD